MKRNVRTLTLAASAVILLAPLTEAAEPAAKAQPRDRIDVIACLTLSGKTIAAIQTGSHWRRNYIYLKDAANQTLTIVDVTDPVHPVIAKTVSMRETPDADALGAVVGDAALVIEGAAANVVRSPKTVSVVNFSDPANPRTITRFPGVTAVHIDSERGLIYLADSDGLRILRGHPAPDAELEKEYARHVLYNP